MNEPLQVVLDPKKKKWVGMGIGAIAGLVFSLVCWGIDAGIQSFSNGYLPWIQLVIGGSLTIFFSAICGLLVTIVNQVFFTFLTWVGWGIFEIYLVSVLPFSNLEKMLVSINPLLKGEISYTSLANPEGRYFVVGIIGFLCCLFITFFFQNAISQVWSGMYAGMAFIAMSVWLVFFIIFGVVLDDVFHRSQRNAIVVTHQTIQTAKQHPEYFNNPRLSSEKLVSALKDQQDWLWRDHTIVIKSYDKLMETYKLLVDFDGYWTTCTEAYNTLIICK